MYKPAFAALAACLTAACSSDGRGIAGPAPHQLPAEVLRAAAAMSEDGAAAVAIGADSTGAPIYVVASLLEVGEDGVEAVIPSGDERNVFIVNPNGGRNTGNGNPGGWNRRAIPGLNPVTGNQGFGFFCNGQIVPGVRVDSVVQRDSERPSGGHGSRHVPVSKPYGRWLTKSGVSGGDGWFWSQYEANIASGDERILVYFHNQVAGNPCNGRRLTGIWRAAVNVRGLVPLRASQNYSFGPTTSDHTNIYYMRPEYVGMTERAAAYYRESFGQNLVVTAGSIPFGGIADVSRNWNPPHSTHRIGTDLDIDGSADNARVWQRLILAGQQAGFAHCEPHNRNHVHCYGRRY
jgi:hypothetical protein